MKALDDYNIARDKLNKEFDTVIYEGIQDHRDSWWWLDDHEINWFDEKPEGTFEEIIANGPMYSEYVRAYYESKCGLFVGMDVHDCCGNSDFYILDKSKCLGEISTRE